MATYRIQMKMVVAISFVLLQLVLPVSSTCYAQTCSTYASGCSTNTNCICFQLVNGTGMCAAQTSTSGLNACTSNLTCADNTTICVVNSCFGQPLCYPLFYANYSTCPPSSVTSVPVNTQAPTPYNPSGSQGNGGLNVGIGAGADEDEGAEAGAEGAEAGAEGAEAGAEGAEAGAEVGGAAIGGIVAAVVVVVIIIIVICVIFRPGC